MNRQIVCAALLFLWSAAASAISVDVTSMILGTESNSASGTLSSDTGTGFYSFGTVAGLLFGQAWIAGASEFFDDTSGSTLHFAGTAASGETFDYAFTLSPGQIAWGMWFDTNSAVDWPVLNIMDCGAGNPGSVCTGIGTPWQTGPFVGVNMAFNGVVTGEVPVPTAVWLFGSGLLALIGAARRKVA
jgi:hypothetical protein